MIHTAHRVACDRCCLNVGFNTTESENQTIHETKFYGKSKTKQLMNQFYTLMNIHKDLNNSEC